jgi:hypothetical protein
VGASSRLIKTIMVIRRPGGCRSARSSVARKCVHERLWTDMEDWAQRPNSHNANLEKSTVLGLILGVYKRVVTWNIPSCVSVSYNCSLKNVMTTCFDPYKDHLQDSIHIN